MTDSLLWSYLLIYLKLCILSDRILVSRQGRIVEEFIASDVTETGDYVCRGPLKAGTLRTGNVRLIVDRVSSHLNEINGAIMLGFTDRIYCFCGPYCDDPRRYHEKSLGSAAGTAPDAALDTLSVGTTAENENITFDLAYVTYASQSGYQRRLPARSRMGNRI